MSAFSETLLPPSQLLERNEDLFAGKRLLLTGCVQDNYAQHLQTLTASLSVFTYDYGVYQALKARNSGMELICAAEYQAPSRHDAALVYMPKSKAEAEFLLANVASQLEPGAQIYLVGETRGGVRSADKLLAPYGEQINKLDSARRCALYTVQLTKTVPAFALTDWFRSFTIEINQQAVEVKSLPGVFSHGSLDEGTQLLLANLPKPGTKAAFAGRTLDFGCGAGVIGCYLAHHYPEIELEMVDVSALAVASSQATLAANQVEGKTYLSNVYSDVEGRFKQIVSNPPFHAGLKTHYASTETFLEQAKDHMKRNSTLTIVANSFLRYPPILEQHFGQYQTVVGNKRFNVYSCHKK